MINPVFQVLSKCWFPYLDHNSPVQSSLEHRQYWLTQEGGRNSGLVRVSSHLGSDCLQYLFTLSWRSHVLGGLLVLSFEM